MKDAIDDPATVSPLQWTLQPGWELEYRLVNDNIARLAEIRFSLVKLVPTITIVGATIMAFFFRIGPGGGLPVGAAVALAVALAGFVVTLGIVAYDQRNSELYNGLIHRAKDLERQAHLVPSFGARRDPAQAWGGQYGERPKAAKRVPGTDIVLRHDLGLALIYGPVLALWLFVIIYAVASVMMGAPAMFGASQDAMPGPIRGLFTSVTGLAGLVAAVAGGVAIVWWLLKEDDRDRGRWADAYEDDEIRQFVVTTGRYAQREPARDWRAIGAVRHCDDGTVVVTDTRLNDAPQSVQMLFVLSRDGDGWRVISETEGPTPD